MIHSFSDFKRNKWKHFRKAAMISLLTCTFAAATLGNAFPVRAEKGNSAAESSQTGENSGSASSDEKVITGYDVVYVIDNSKSVWGQSKERNNAFRQITEEAAGKDVRIGVVYFADHIYKQLPLTSMEDEEGSKIVLSFLDMTDTDNNNIDTNIGTALEVAATFLVEKDENREQMVVLFSDGINENASGDEEYKEAADEKTREQVSLLEESNIPIYCVYLQKTRNDEDYLKNLVNYFSADHDYDSERFEKVTSDRIEKLDDSFAALFKNLENEVEIRQEESSQAESIRIETSEEVTTEKETEKETQELNETEVKATEVEQSALQTEESVTASQSEADDTIKDTEAAKETTLSGSSDDGQSPELTGLVGKAAMVGLLGLLAAAVAAILIALKRGVKKARKSSMDTTEFKVDNDFGALRMNYEWTLDDFENAADKWKLYEPELHKLLKKGRISTLEYGTMVDGMEGLVQSGEPIIASINKLIEENKDKFFENGKNKLAIARVREVNEELSKGTAELKAISDQMVEILKKAEDLILK